MLEGYSPDLINSNLLEKPSTKLKKKKKKVIFFLEKLSLLPETSAPKEHFKLVFGSGNSDPVE